MAAAGEGEFWHGLDLKDALICLPASSRCKWEPPTRATPASKPPSLPPATAAPSPQLDNRPTSAFPSFLPLPSPRATPRIYLGRDENGNRLTPTVAPGGLVPTAGKRYQYGTTGTSGFKTRTYTVKSSLAPQLGSKAISARSPGPVVT